jgi:hypothetical protein
MAEIVEHLCAELNLYRNMSEFFCFIHYKEGVHVQNFRNIFAHNRVMAMKPHIS